MGASTNWAHHCPVLSGACATDQQAMSTMWPERVHHGPKLWILRGSWLGQGVFLLVVAIRGGQRSDVSASSASVGAKAVGIVACDG